MSIFDNVQRLVLELHEQLYVRTDGVVGHRMIGVPCLLLRTTGRRSGKTRTNALFYARDGNRWIVVASKGGDPKPPAWLLNLQAHPLVEVQVGRVRHAASAGVIEHEDPEYARLWKLVNDRNHNRYDGYQRRTARPIPLVALTPEL